MSYKHHSSHQRRSAPDEGVRDGRQPPQRACTQCGATDRDEAAAKPCPGGELLLIENVEDSGWPTWDGEAAEP